MVKYNVLKHDSVFQLSFQTDKIEFISVVVCRANLFPLSVCMMLVDASVIYFLSESLIDQSTHRKERNMTHKFVI